MPFMAVRTKSCAERWVSAQPDQHMVKCTLPATQKPKAAVGTNIVFSNPQAQTVFISLRAWPLLSQTKSCELAVAPAHLVLTGLVRVAQPLPAALQLH